MAVYILDTTTLTLLQRNHPRVSAALTAHAADTIGVTAINVEEVVGGWLALLRRAKSNAQEAQASQALADAIPFLAQFAVYPVTEPALDHFDRLVKLKLNVGKMDLKVAAVALEMVATVVTNPGTRLRSRAGIAVGRLVRTMPHRVRTGGATSLRIRT